MYGQSAHSHQPGLNLDQKPGVISIVLAEVM